MKKIILLNALVFACVLNAQFSNGKQFVEFCKLSLDKQKISLKANGWESVSSTSGGSKPNAAFKVTQANYYRFEGKSGTYALSIKVGSLPAGKMKETKLVLPNEQGLILSDWISELSRSGYKFSAVNSYVMTSTGKNYTIMIKMIPSNGYSSPISEISYMAH